MKSMRVKKKKTKTLTESKEMDGAKVAKVANPAQKRQSPPRGRKARE